MRVALITLAAGLLSCTAMPAAIAQVFSGSGPTQTFVLPPSLDASPKPEAENFPSVLPSRNIRRPQPNSASLRLSGENGRASWAFYVTETEARVGGRFAVSYLSAISVLPEASTITLAINDEVVGTAPVEGASGIRTIHFDIPPGRFVPGYNAVGVSVDQRHRVDCTLAATYELWTQIDVDGTGFLVGTERAGTITDLRDLPALGVASDGATPIRLVHGTERLTEVAVERLLTAVQELVLAGRVVQPVVDFGAPAGGTEGINFAVGTAGTMASILGPRAVEGIVGPHLALLPSRPDRRPTLLATGTTEAEVEQALARLATIHKAKPLGTKPGLRVLADAAGRPVEGGERITLHEFGFADVSFTGRQHRIVIDLLLPHDVLVADYAKLVLEVTGRYAAGLATDAKILAEINGVNAASVELGQADATKPTRKTIFLPLRLMRPGFNRIVVATQLPRKGEATCPVAATPEAERMTLSASTTIVVPPLARIARQPDIGQTFGAGYPYAAAHRPTTLLVPAPDRSSMAAAATLAARLARAGGKPVPFRFSATRLSGSGPTIAIAPARAFDPSLLTAAGIDPNLLRDAWRTRLPLEAGGAPETAYGSAARQRRLLRQDGIEACHAWDGATAPSEAVGGSRNREAADFARAFGVVAQAITGPEPDDVLTVATASDAPSLEMAMRCLVHPRVWHAPEGRLATLSGSGAIASLTPDAPRYVATAPLSIGNLRRIAAGWLSLNAGLYALLALLVAACLAGSTHWLLGSLGRKSP
ncbi:cellulose biosynthesis cyclic di-GMP-binding regulatory protein BcsB [Methylobacterium iners]|uniref:Cyclic di-GMP-binding protein n=1 Tax=Methylobacterium iners TaxID=418707 RepID=A0ABQ4RYD9_9HYPH|nr:cellulose biosynthesis cyclic di-GMP-binding regulatory protein BcsB [Methylobacterium iners]GJD95856.1 hypothetical protein OCOJLMKI_3072 [Methylobacterium iners]